MKNKWYLSKIEIKYRIYYNKKIIFNIINYLKTELTIKRY